MRRSTRIKPATASASDIIPSEELEGQTNEDSTSTQQVASAQTVKKSPVKTSKAGRNKRKSGPQKAKDSNPSPPKRMRGIRGLLESLSTMPMDVLVEIFVYLGPIDLLYLTWTAKDLRTLLLTKNANSRAIWKNAISNMPDLPPCPVDLSEPKYVHLLFADVCNLCERRAKTVEIFWEARIRACKNCAQKEFTIKSIPKKLKPVEDLIPFADIKLRQNYYRMYHRKTFSLWEEEYQQAADKQAWIECKISERQTMRTHIQACQTWKRNYEKMIQDEKIAIMESRKSMIMERLKKIGWEERQINDLSYRNVHPLMLVPVQKAWRNNLTEKILDNLEPILSEYMQALKIAGQARTREELLSKHRLPVLKQAYDAVISTLPANSIYPGLADVFTYPAIQEIIELPLTVDVKPMDYKLGSLFSEITAQWKKDVEAHLIAMIPDSCIPEDMKKSNSVNLFDLATVSFYCGCWGYPTRYTSLRYPEVMMHSCASTVPRYNSVNVEDADLRTVENKFFSVTWNASSAIHFSERAFGFISEGIKMCGMDPMTATATQMNEMAPIFECITCHDEYFGRATMGWDHLAMHWVSEMTKHTEAENALPLLLDESETSNVRQRIAEETERARAKPDYKNLICTLCKQVGNATDLVKHVKKDHGVSVVKDEYVALRMGLGKDSYLFRLWPPRAPGELGPTPMVVG